MKFGKIDRLAYALGTAALAMGLMLVPGPAMAQGAFKCSTAAVNEVTHEWCKLLAARLPERTGGRVKVEVFPGGQLGDVPQQVSGVQFGTIESMSAPGAFFVGIDPRFQVLDAPGLYESWDHIYKTSIDPAFRGPFLQSGEDKGIAGISIFMQAPNNIVSKRPIRTLDDVKGLKIRVFGSPLQMEPIKLLGGTPAPMPLLESLPALQTGVIDGTIGSQFIFTNFKYFTVAKHVTRMPFSYVTMLGAVSKVWLDKQPADVQKIVRAVGQEVEKDLYEFSKEKLPLVEKIWIDNGGEIISLSAADLKKMNDLVLPIGGQVAQERPQVKALYDIMVDAAKRHR